MQFFTGCCPPRDLGIHAFTHDTSSRGARWHAVLMRTTRRVAVTEAGKQLLLTLEPGLARIEAGVTALQRLRHTPAGLVRLTVSDHMIHECLWPRLSPLLKKYPDIKVEMSQQNGFVDIVEGNFDAGVRIGDDILKDMVAVRIAPDIRFVVIGSSTYLAERGLPLHPSQLDKHDCINIRLSPTGPLSSLILHATCRRSVTSKEKREAASQIRWKRIFP